MKMEQNSFKLEIKISLHLTLEITNYTPQETSVTFKRF